MSSESDDELESRSAVPVRLPNTDDIAARARTDARAGAVWKLRDPQRQLDANVISLPPGDAIARHLGPALDVLIHVVSGSGELRTELGTTALVPGALAWLPRGTVREFYAGEQGLCYLSVHQRNQNALSIGAAGPRDSA